MPCKPQKARKLLKEDKATVIKHEPFTLQLKYGSAGYKQPVTLGIDAGSVHIGASASTKKQELYVSETVMRSDDGKASIVRLIAKRRELRRSRRTRKTRYRKTRFLNRVHRKHKGWLAPSVENKINVHLKLVADIYKILSVTKVVAEVAQFDIQKIKKPNISGVEYQQGEQLGWGYHQGNVSLPRSIHRGMSFRDAAFMVIMHWAFYNRLKEQYPDVHLTYGYITKNTRIKNGIAKTHTADAYCIAGNVEAERLGYEYLRKQVLRHNRKLHKESLVKGSIRKRAQAGYTVRGFCLNDTVLYQKQRWFVRDLRTKGSFVLKHLDGEKTEIAPSKITFLWHNNSYLVERRKAAWGLPLL